MFNLLFKSIFKDIISVLKFSLKDDNDLELNQNTSGDFTKKIDKECENIFIKHLENNNLNIIGYISEEKNKITYFKNIKQDNSKNLFIVAFDPLDGSSNYNSNINTGSIYGVYKYDNKLLDIVESGYCLYGINNVMVYTENNKVIMEMLDEKNNFIKIKNLHFDKIKNKKKIYSINESNNYNKNIKFILEQYKLKKYTARWVGTLVADAHRILINDGVFLYPSTKTKPNGKIRLLYESYPFSHIFKIAGGVGLTDSFELILPTITQFDLNKPHKTSGIILASNTEYQNLKNMLL